MNNKFMTISLLIIPYFILKMNFLQLFENDKFSQLFNYFVTKDCT